jgi:hypothetical protein
MTENGSDKSIQQGQFIDDKNVPKDDKSNFLRFVNEIAATVILALSAICIVVAIVIFAIGSKREVVRHEYTYTIKVDSTGNVTPAARLQVDSMISTIKHHEHLIQDRYDYVLEQRENSQDYFTVGGIFVTVILSIFGFFGYKSFRNIEEDAKASAKKIAADKAEEIANDKATKVATKLNNRLNIELKKEQKETLLDFKEKDIPDMVSRTVEQKFGIVVGDKMSKVDAALEKIPALENGISELKRARDEGNLIKKPVRKKRCSLADGPGLQPAELNTLAQSIENETPISKD